MKGYCSNSPIRCSNAQSCEIVEAKDVCPKCRMALIEAHSKSDNVKKVKRHLLQLFSFIGILGFIFSILFLRYNA